MSQKNKKNLNFVYILKQEMLDNNFPNKNKQINKPLQRKNINN